jgi:hypothetical protein
MNVEYLDKEGGSYFVLQTKLHTWSMFLDWRDCDLVLNRINKNASLLYTSCSHRGYRRIFNLNDEITFEYSISDDESARVSVPRAVFLDAITRMREHNRACVELHNRFIGGES